MDFGWLLLLGFIYFVLNVMSKGKPGVSGGGAPPRRSGVPGEEPESGGASSMQIEAGKLERMMRELHLSLEEGEPPRVATKKRPPPMRQTPPVRRAPALPSEEEWEERQSLETEPRVTSLENLTPRAARQMVDHDDQAGATAQRRISAAEQRNRAVTPADHRAFDKRIRQEPADRLATRARTVAELRQAVVWNEILGKPVALRDE
jgi:hypothetical protein